MKCLIAFLVTVLLAYSSSAQVRISETSAPKAEPHVAVNPTNPNHIVVVAITKINFARIGAYRTTNGGVNWIGSDDIVQQVNVDAGDPVVAFDGAGNVYVLYQVRTQGKLYLLESMDGGVTWEPAMTVFTGDPDRPWMAIDESPNAAGFYDIFVAVTSFEGSQVSDIVLTRSTDGGASFFAATLSAVGNNQGSYVAIGPDNDVFVAWAELSSVNAVTQIKVRRSTDRGVTFSGALILCTS
ncbi:MAG: exo-alpha-sialidase [Bacteroidetes bacterium]|nr:exo-alpha-sialidase [Bacteroidota bacterium]MCW5894230.1 exo-alpha-sialidase [Bacteroidota bacterium]